MFKYIKRCIKYWKQSRKAKRYIQKQIHIASKAGPAEITRASIDAVVNDWKKQGIDITKPNFGLDNGQITWQ